MLYVQIKELSFEVGHFEPFYCSLALYDFRERRRISENFYFDFSDPEMLAESHEQMVGR